MPFGLGAIVRAVISLPIGYLFALIAREFFGAILPVMQNAPASEWQSRFVGAATIMEEQFLLLVILSTCFTLIAQAFVTRSGAI